MLLRTIFAALVLGVCSTGWANTYTVTNTNDSGAGSLRQAVLDANANAGFDLIHFNIGGGGAQTIGLTSGSLFVTESVNINAKTQPGYGGTPLITIDCSDLVNEAFFLTGHDVTTIQGFIIHSFLQNAITLWEDSNGNWILDNWLGIDSSGNDATSSVFVRGIGVASSFNVIRRNVISGVSNGITMGGSIEIGPTRNSQGNYIADNIIGLNPTGTAAVPNTSDGIFLGDGAHSNFLGPNNTISGNDSAGIELLHSSNRWNVIYQNRIGLNQAGTGVIGNGAEGILLSNGAHNNAIGGGFGGNFISGNTIGIHAGDVATYNSSWGNWMRYNKIGVDVNGNPAGNDRVGIFINGSGSYWNTIGQNVIGNNGWWGLYIKGGPTNWVEYNNIGQDAVGNPMGNGYDGIYLEGAGWNTIIWNNVTNNGWQPGFDWAAIRQDAVSHTTGYWRNLTRDGAQVLAAINAHRAAGTDCPTGAKNPVGPLTLNEQLHDAAQRHAQDMGLNDFLDHTGSDNSSPEDRINDAGYIWSTWGENAAAGSSLWRPTQVVALWMSSTQGHCDAIMKGAYIDLGVGHFITNIPSSPPTWGPHYWVLNFGAP